MKIRRHTCSVSLALLCAAATFADNMANTIDAGGGRSSAGSYVNDACIGGIGGMADKGNDTNRAGYVGQLTEVSSLAVAGMPATVNETATTQLSGAAIMDDATVTVLTGGEINWVAPAWPLAAINPSGVASTAVVYANTSATVNGIYLGVAGSGSVRVLDNQPDNYGSYAGDGLPDSWQNQFFGLDNPNASPGEDVTGTGQNNLFKYTAGLDPTNAASVFRLRIEPVAGLPNQKKLIFSPRWTDRSYALEFRTNLVGGSTWTNQMGASISDVGVERTMTDTNATEQTKFYRIKISLP